MNPSGEAAEEECTLDLLRLIGESSILIGEIFINWRRKVFSRHFNLRRNKLIPPNLFYKGSINNHWRVRRKSRKMPIQWNQRTLWLLKEWSIGGHSQPDHWGRVPRLRAIFRNRKRWIMNIKGKCCSFSLNLSKLKTFLNNTIKMIFFLSFLERLPFRNSDTLKEND